MLLLALTIVYSSAERGFLLELKQEPSYLRIFTAKVNIIRTVNFLSLNCEIKIGGHMYSYQ